MSLFQGAAAASMHFLGHNPGSFIIGLFGILLMWIYGKFWISGMLLIAGGLYYLLFYICFFLLQSLLLYFIVIMHLLILFPRHFCFPLSSQLLLSSSTISSWNILDWTSELVILVFGFALSETSIMQAVYFFSVV